MPPRGSQEVPKRPPRGPKTLPRGPKRAPRGSKEALKAHLGAILAPSWAILGHLGRPSAILLRRRAMAKNLQKPLVFEGFLKVWRSSMARKSKKIRLRWRYWLQDLLGDFRVMLRHVGGKMATKSARMSQHKRQGPNPPGFEGFAASPDG